MRARDVLSYSFSAIKLRKLRAGLTTLGVVIGIAAIVALLSISQGLQTTITAQLQRGFATDTLIVTAGGGGGFGLGGGLGGGGDSGFQLLVSDTQTINGLPNVDSSVAIIQRVVNNVSVGGTNRPGTVTGVDFARYLDIYGDTFKASNGTIPIPSANDSIVVGKRVVDPHLNGTTIAGVNDPIGLTWINGTARPPTTVTFSRHISAVLNEIGSFGVGGPSDSGIYIPITQAQILFETNECDMIIVKLKSSDQAVIDNVSSAIKNAFSGEVSVISATAVLGIISSIFSVIELFLGGIAAISLVVAGIGIMNIMIVSLMERTREIGILKALGTKSRTVLLIFLSEAAIIGVVGGAIGIGLGWVLANVVAIVFRGGGPFMGNQTAATAGNGGLTITPILTPPVFLGAMAFGIGVSVIFALYPAWRASKLKPVDALRYE
jgi:putative ABC transport system permease protein